MGLKNDDVPTLFKWSDHSPVVFTYWDQNEPKVPFNSTPNCVSYSGKVGIPRVLSWVVGLYFFIIVEATLLCVKVSEGDKVDS